MQTRHDSLNAKSHFHFHIFHPTFLQEQEFSSQQIFRYFIRKIHFYNIHSLGIPNDSKSTLNLSSLLRSGTHFSAFSLQPRNKQKNVDLLPAWKMFRLSEKNKDFYHVHCENCTGILHQIWHKTNVVLTKTSF